MRIQALVVVAALLVGISWLQAQDPKPAPDTESASASEPFPAGYLDHDGLTAAIKRVAEAHPENVRVRSLAKTGQGRDVWLVSVGRPEKKDEAAKPAVLLVANLEADHVVGSQVALGLVERVADGDGKDPAVAALLDRRTIHVVPRLNPDGAERLLTGKPRTDLRTNLTAVDRDRDRKADEDGPDDLDGDGLATRMRVKDLKATLIADAKDAAHPPQGRRESRASAPSSRTTPKARTTMATVRSTRTPIGGVNLNRNWPYRWTEFDPETGSSAASEPEVHALIAWAFDHPEIAAVWTFSLNDNLKVEPKKPGSTLDDADLPYFVEFCKLHAQFEKPGSKAAEKRTPSPAKRRRPRRKRRMKRRPRPRLWIGPSRSNRPRTPAPVIGPRCSRHCAPSAAFPRRPAAPPGGAGIEGTTDGAMSEWAYHQFGVIGLASRLWPKPDLPEPAKGETAPPLDGEARWLHWNDKVMGGRAFVPFHEVDHPSLGKVSVGGWKPGVRLNPPAGRIDAIEDVELAFLKALASKLPSLALSEVKVESKGGGLFEIKAVVTNDGYLPTALVQGVRTRKSPPVLVRLKAGDAKLLAGKPLERISSLAGSGGRQEFRWLLLAPEGVKSATLEVSCPKAGQVVKDIELK